MGENAIIYIKIAELSRWQGTWEGTTIEIQNFSVIFLIFHSVGYNNLILFKKYLRLTNDNTCTFFNYYYWIKV